MTGKEMHNIPIQEAVEPFIVAKGKKRRWFEEAEMDDENSTVRARKKGQKGKGKGKAKEVAEKDVDMEEAGDNGTPAPVIEENTPEGGPQESIRPEIEELVLAIQRIESFETPRGKHLVFSAFGYVLRPSYLCLVFRLCPISSCTSLFTCPFPSQGDTSSPTIQTFDLYKPVIDFCVHDSLFWVLVDDGWGDESVKSNPVHCLKWSNELQEVGHRHKRSETERHALRSSTP